MEDLYYAKELMKNEELAIAIVKDGKCIYKSKERGIYPLYIAVTQFRDDMKNSSAADKVIGRGAALLYKYAEVRHIYSKMISEGSKKVFEEANIGFETEETVPYIMNRDKSGMCPVETLSYESNNMKELILNIEIFLRKINLLK